MIETVASKRVRWRLHRESDLSEHLRDQVGGASRVCGRKKHPVPRVLRSLDGDFAAFACFGPAVSPAAHLDRKSWGVVTTTTGFSADPGRWWSMGRVEEGTMMGHHCLRAMSGGGFVATVERGTGDLVVKLPKSRVAELIETNGGRAFAPAGRVFREWVAISVERTDRWPSLIEESIEFVGNED